MIWKDKRFYKNTKAASFILTFVLSKLRFSDSTELEFGFGQTIHQPFRKLMEFLANLSMSKSDGFQIRYFEFAKFPPKPKLTVVKVPQNSQPVKTSKSRKQELTI